MLGDALMTRSPRHEAKNKPVSNGTVWDTNAWSAAGLSKPVHALVLNRPPAGANTMLVVQSRENSDG